MGVFFLSTWLQPEIAHPVLPEWPPQFLTRHKPVLALPAYHSQPCVTGRSTCLTAEILESALRRNALHQCLLHTSMPSLCVVWTPLPVRLSGPFRAQRRILTQRVWPEYAIPEVKSADCSPTRPQSSTYVPLESEMNMHSEIWNTAVCEGVRRYKKQQYPSKNRIITMARDFALK